MNPVSKRIVIVGGSDVGITAGLRIRELDKEANVTVISNNNYPNFSICGIPFFLGGEVKDYKDLAHRTADDIRAMGLKLLLDSTVRSVDTASKAVSIIDGKKKESVLSYDQLVLATGGKSIRPLIEGLDLPGVFFLRWIEEALEIDRYIHENKPESAVVVGGGYIGLEMAEAFIRRGLRVTLIEFEDRILTTVDKEFSERVKKMLEEKGAEIVTGRKVQSIVKEKGQLTVKAAPDYKVSADMVLAAVGAEPETALGKSIGVKTGLKGSFKVNEKMQTNIDDIYAGGDCAESLHNITGKPVYIALGTTAHKHGRIIGENICGLKSEYPGTLATQSIKLFDTVIARTGLNNKEAADAGFDPFTSAFETTDHKVYYPPAYKTQIRLTADRKTERILGCAIIGHIDAEISKRIDIVAAAIHKKTTVPEFIKMDLSYTPPLSSPWDPVQMAAQGWERKERREI